MAPRILFLDDDKARHRKVKPFLLHDEAYTVDQAVDLLKQNTYDAIFLDHNLDGEEMAAPSPDTGMAVAKYIVEHQVPASLIVIHSNNPDASAQMAKLLIVADYDVIRLPFMPMIVNLSWILDRLDLFINHPRRPHQEDSST